MVDLMHLLRRPSWGGTGSWKLQTFQDRRSDTFPVQHISAIVVLVC